jgi:hypothetical protein
VGSRPLTEWVGHVLRKGQRMDWQTKTQACMGIPSMYLSVISSHSGKQEGTVQTQTRAYVAPTPKVRQIHV